MNEICRTCLQEVGDGSVMFYLDAVDSHSETITIRCKLADCVPEMDLDVVPNAFICKNCFESLMVAHEFKNKCLETEGRIQSYIEQMGYVLTSVDLREIVQQSKVQLPTIDIKPQISKTFLQSTAITEESSHIRTTLYDANKNPIKIKVDSKGEESLDLKNLQCDTKAFFAVPKIAQLLAEGDRNVYNCSQCNFKASTEFELKSHEETHQTQRFEKRDFFTVPKITQLLTAGNGTSSYKCHQCYYVASSDLDLKSHEETHRICNTNDFFALPKIPHLSENNENSSCSSLQCTQCTYAASSDLDLKSHEESHLITQKLHKCTECDYSAPKRQTLIIHMRKHSGERVYSCSKCDYRTQYRDMLTEHLKTHVEGKPYKCMLCDFSSMYSNVLSKHIRLHADEKVLKTHKPYKCPLCEYSSSHKTNFNYHLREHSGERFYKCKFCNYRTSQKSNLHVHNKIHTMEKPFRCLKCNYSTVHSKSLTSHLRIHTGENLYSCTFCSYNTFIKLDLIKHIMTHTEEEEITVTEKYTEKSSQCAVCQKTFGNIDNLERHKKHHNTKDLPTQRNTDSQMQQEIGEPSSSSHIVDTTGNDNKDYCQDKSNCESAVKNEMII